MTLTCKRPPFEKLCNLGCYFVMVAARRASLASDKSYLKMCHVLKSRLVLVLIKGKLVMSFKINTQLRYKTSWSEIKVENLTVDEIWSRFYQT